jgi:lipoate-protein ligase A
LNYNLTLPITDETASITATNRFVMERHREAMQTLIDRKVEQQGCTDLTIDGLKFSGNAQRRRSRAVVFHGCFLLNFDLNLVEALLAHPSKEPDYRKHRSHREFLMNLKLPSEAVKAALAKAWSASQTAAPPNRDRINTLVRERYGNRSWNEKF